MKKLKNLWIILTRRGIISLVISIIYYIKYLFYKFLFSQKYLKKNIYNFKMFLDLNDRGLSRTLIFFGQRELDHKIILENVLKKNMSVLDIGSNIGYYILMQRKLIGTKAKILAVEPIPENIKLLKKNLQLNNDYNTEVIPGAVSNKNNFDHIYRSNHSNLGTFHPFGSSKKFIKDKIKVKTFKLSSLCLKKGFPKLIRMDVEGHEVKIFEDLFLNRNKFKYFPMICFETHLTKYSNENSMFKILKKLFSIGYYVEFASSSSKRGTKIMEELLKYAAVSKIIKTDEEERKIFKNIKNDDALDLICRTGGLRTVLLSNKFNNEKK